MKTSLFSTGIGSLGPIAVDVATRRVFWADIDLRRIESGDFDGGHRQVLVEGNVGTPAGIGILGAHLYWVDRTCCGILERADKTNGHDRTRLPIAASAGNLTDLVIVRKLSSQHPCIQNNGGCSHLCVVQGSAVRCSCPLGLALGVDERTCTTPPTCTLEQFTCHNGFCIPLSWRCDGYSECDDDSDELNCSSCRLPTQFLCPATGQCMQPRVRCDGKSQCPDGSDEADCVYCGSDKFKCETDTDLRCIDLVDVCDGENDCNDGSDEQRCNDVTPIDATRQSAAAAAMPYAIGIGLIGGITVIVFFIFLVICLCRQKTREQIVLDDRNDIIMVAKATASPTVTIALSDICSELSVSAPNYGILPPPPSTISLVGGKSSRDGREESLIYDRDHITGASSSSSTTTAARLAYPKETLNPPPSPVTERSRSIGQRRGKGGMRAVVKAKLYKRRRKHCRMRSHPTTPCSTDVCEDSEPPYLGDGAYEYCLGANGYAYESDPLCPPPPTPHSQYLSEEPSCPPSPRSTEYSFFMPYPPPPPSTAGSQDC